jgi:predicted alpha/beta superfamily hydrolase
MFLREAGGATQDARTEIGQAGKRQGDRMTGKTLVLLFSLCVVLADTCIGEAVSIGESHRIHSSQLREDREYKVYLPENYKWARDKRYPVFYVLDGNSHFLHSAASVDFLSAQGEIPEMIVVAIASTVRVRDFTQTDWSSHWVGGGGAGRFRAFLSKELIPEIDKTYRTQDFRVLSGHSAGGQFALYCLTSEPTLFQAYFALSPSLDWDDKLPLRSLESYFSSTPTLTTFVYVGRGDDYAGGEALAEFNKLVEILGKAPRGVRSEIRSFPQETHTTLPLLAQIDALRSLYSGWRVSEATLDKGLAAVETQYENLSKMLGRPVGVPENVLNDLGYASLEQGKIREAIALFQSNVEANPNSATAYDSLAQAFVKDGQLSAAKSAEDHCVQIARQWANPNLVRFEQKANKIGQQLKEQEAGRKQSSPMP